MFCDGSVAGKLPAKSRQTKKLTNTSSFINIQDTNSVKILQHPEPITQLYDYKANCSEKKYVDAKNFNIFHIDSIIKEYLISQIRSLPVFEKELLALTQTLSSGDYSKQVLAKQKVTDLRRKIKDLETTFGLSLYILNTAKLLEDYRTAISSNNSRSFVCVNKETADTESAKRDEIITKYLLIARNYVEITNYNQVTKKMACPVCESSDMRRSGDEETIFVCMVCLTETQILDDTPSFKDTDRVNMCSRYTYSRKGHFMDAIKKHQGKQNVDPETIQNVVNILLNEMKFHNIGPENVNKRHLHMFLFEKGLSMYYEDLNLLYHIITGEPCPEISAYESQIYEDFEEQEAALNNVSALDVNDTRINSLNVYYKLYKLLQRRGHRCRKDDFYILKTKTKEDEHDEKMRKAWAMLGWKWIETF